MTAVMAASLLLYVFVAIYMRARGHGGKVYRLAGAYLITGVNVCLVSSLTTVLSIRIPRPINALVSSLVALGGVPDS